jgi:hypothetical protein
MVTIGFIVTPSNNQHYLEINNFNDIPRMQANASWYFNGQLKQTKKIFPSSISSGSKVTVQIGAKSGVTKTPSFTAGPIAMTEDGSVIWATGSSSGERQLIVSKTFEAGKIEDSDTRLNCTVVGANNAGTASSHTAP